MARRILIAGHRGYKSKEIENTFAAFQRAVREQVDFAEFDVMQTRDGVPVIFHDRVINRLLNGKGFLKNFTIAELKKMHYADGQEILTLEEYCQKIGRNIRPLLEIKARGVEESVLRLLKQYDLEAGVIIQSFDAHSLRRCYQISPELPYALNIGPLFNLGPVGDKLRLNSIIARLEFLQLLSRVPVTYIHPDGPFVYDAFISYARAQEKRVILGARRVWAYIPKLLQWGVEIVNCDNPAHIRQVIKAHWGNNIQCEPKIE